MGATDGLKQTNETGMASPLLNALNIAGKTITVDALRTQRKIAAHVVARGAHYLFIVKGNQPTARRCLQMRRPVAGRSRSCC